MEIIQQLKQQAGKLKKEITALFYAYRDPRTPWYAKLLLALTVGYALSPIDLIPDFIPLLGYLDDLILLPLFITLSIRCIPENILLECRKRAEDEPLTLKKNWFFAVLFILIWVVILIVLVYAVLSIWKTIG